MPPTNINSKRIITPTFSVSDSLTRPANTTAYSANKAINCNLTVTAGSYSGKTVTLTSNGHPLAVNDRITVAGINAGYTWTNVDGNWVVSAVTTNTFSFEVTTAPTGATPASGSVANAIAKMLSLDVAGVAGGGVLLSSLVVSMQGVAMTGAIRVHIYKAQITALVDRATRTLLAANASHLLDVLDGYPTTEGTGSDMTAATIDVRKEYKCAAGDTRLYFTLTEEGASTPVSGAVITIRGQGQQLLG